MGGDRTGVLEGSGLSKSASFDMVARWERREALSLVASRS